MRILWVGGRMEVMLDDVMNSISPSQICRLKRFPHQIILRNGSTIDVVQIRDVHDLDKLRGNRWDLVIDHQSFPRDREMYELLKAMTHR